MGYKNPPRSRMKKNRFHFMDESEIFQNVTLKYVNWPTGTDRRECRGVLLSFLPFLLEYLWLKMDSCWYYDFR